MTFHQKMGLLFPYKKLTVVPSGFEIQEVPAFGKGLQEWKSSPSAWSRLQKLQHWLENGARWDLPLALANVEPGRADPLGHKFLPLSSGGSKEPESSSSPRHLLPQGHLHCLL